MPIKAVVVLLALAVVSACGTESSEPGSSAGGQLLTDRASMEPVGATGLVRIDDPKLICMVNDTYMGREQIPVAVDGKTYFGCCPMCEERLKHDPTVRKAVDPVTGNPVDKATAVLAQTPNGAVLYFADEESLRAYRPSGR